MLFMYLVEYLAFSQDITVSGPQVGEKLALFKARLVLGEKAGRDPEFAPASHQGPQLLLFVHEVNRQTVALAPHLAQILAVLGQVRGGHRGSLARG